MEFLHCNRCFQRNPPGGYFISSCFHIFCEKCTNSDFQNCPLCKKEVKIVKLNGNISQGLKVYFTDPIVSFTEFLTKIQRKMDFQSNIRTHLMKHLTKQKEKKRQMEVYFRKKGEEFEEQKKQLAELNNWVITAEKKLQEGEEERMRLQREVEEFQTKFQALRTRQQLPVTPSTPFSFMMADSEEAGRRSVAVNSSPNSTFNMISPLVTSPAMSLNETNFHNFFDNTTNAATNGMPDDTMFATVSSNSHQRSTMSDTAAFSATFNNMFTPSRDVEMTMIDKTSVSLENWRTHRIDSSAMDITRRETSLPAETQIPSAPTSSTSLHHLRQNLHNLPRHHSSQAPGAIRDLRRHSSQPGFLAQRKSINNRSGSNGSASFIDQDALF